MARDKCRCCGNEYTVNADGTMRYHIATDPECRDEQDKDSRKCRGAGQRPAGDEPDRSDVATAGDTSWQDSRTCEHEYGGHDVWDEQNGTEANIEACLKCGEIAPGETDPSLFAGPCTCTRSPGDLEGPAVDCPQHGDPAVLFDVTHKLTDSSGTEWIHPGEAGDCRLPDCCTHPRGFVYVDDGKGRSGSFCRVCGEPEPEPVPGLEDWRTPADLLADMPQYVQALAALNPECWDCGHEVTPLVDRFDLYGKPKAIVWSCRTDCQHAERRPGHYGKPCRPRASYETTVGELDEGALFRRHTAKAPIRTLVFRVQAVHPEAIESIVVTEGGYAGRHGMLTNLTEEVTCTDLNGRPRARRGRPQDPGTGGISPSSPAPSPSPSTLSPPAAKTPEKEVPGPGSKLTTKAIARPATSTTSTPETAFGPTVTADTSTRTVHVTDAFATPKEAVKESDKYDSYGRYKMLHPVTGKKVNWTRATTFCKSIQDTYALSMWSQRMVLKGASLRSDLTAAAGTLEVKADKDRMNGLVDEAKKAAGDKIAANKGTAVHSYTEDRDRAWAGLPVRDRAVPEEFVPTVEAYVAILEDFGLMPVPGLIEFTTAVVQYEVAGTSDRVYKVTRDITIKLNGRPVTLYAGEYVVGDVKTGADLSYGWQEIAIQLALYGQGLNTSGVWDWGTRTWSRPEDGNGNQIQVRTDVGIVPHLPVDRSETGAPLATLYAVDLTAGWAAAVLCGQVRSWRKERTLATPLEIADVAEDGPVQEPERPVSRPVAASRPVTLKDKARAVTSKPEASAVYQEAVAARTPVSEVNALIQIMQDKLKSFTEQGA